MRPNGIKIGDKIKTVWSEDDYDQHNNTRRFSVCTIIDMNEKFVTVEDKDGYIYNWGWSVIFEHGGAYCEYLINTKLSEVYYG